LISAYFTPDRHADIAHVADIEEIRINMHILSIPLYVQNDSGDDGQSMESTIEAWQVSRIELKKQSDRLFAVLAGIGVKA
jgi:type I restriction enzyme M protein